MYTHTHIYIYIYIYIYIFFEAVIINCDYFPKLKKKFFLLYKYFAAISVASSVQVTLQFYFQIFYSTVPNKIAIKLTKLKNANY